MGQVPFPEPSPYSQQCCAVALYLIGTQHKIALGTGLVVIISLQECDVLVTIPTDALHIDAGGFPIEIVVVSMVSLQIDRALASRVAIYALILS